MKIITLHVSDEKLIKQAIQKSGKAEEMLYKRYAAKMLGVCRCYIKDMHYAEDVMIEGFTKAFASLGRYRFEGSFEGWLRRIMVRGAIDFLRSRREIAFAEVKEAIGYAEPATAPDMDAELLQLLMDELPAGYRTVLVLFAVEGYNHKEIADMLNITESTSKSQLFKARKTLREQLEKLNNSSYGKV